MPIEVRPATDDDASALAGVLARAFSNDPCMSWAFRDEATRADRLTALFDVGLRELFLPGGHAWTTTELAGAGLWEPPGHWRTPDDVASRMTPVLVDACLPEELDRFLTFLGTMEDAHPDDPEHWYLAVLAADVDRQGQGVGTACMRPILDLADAGGEPAYLESSNERNVPLYERNGFRVVDVIDLPDGGPPVWRMWREPRST